jgi:hypothetical protein
MKPETHLVAGLAIAATLGLDYLPADLAIFTVATVVGAGFPDVPIFGQVIVDKIKGRESFSAEKDPNFENSLWFILKEVSHSPLIWIVTFLISLLQLPFLVKLIFFGFSLGAYSHWVIDLFTHCGLRFRRTDQSMWWPFYHLFGLSGIGRIPKLGYLMGTLGPAWEYRHVNTVGYENTKTKAPERMVQGVAILLWLILLGYKWIHPVW